MLEDNNDKLIQILKYYVGQCTTISNEIIKRRRYKLCIIRHTHVTQSEIK